MEKIKNLWAIKEARQKVLFTALILLLFRVGCGLTVPFINADALSAMFTGTNALSYLNMISGGALAKSAVFALGVSPYINASIIVQLLCVALPSWETLRTEIDGQEKLEKRTKILSVVMSVVMGVGYFFAIRNTYSALKYTGGIAEWFEAIVIIACFVSGAQIVVWMGNLIDAKGIGNGVSLIIFFGIVSRWSEIITAGQTVYLNVILGNWWYILFAIALVAFTIVSVLFVVHEDGSERRIPVVYAKRVVGRKQYGGQSSYIPLKVLMSGVLPIIFANSILSIPATIAMFINPYKHPTAFSLLYGFNTANWIYCVLYAVLIFGFNYFYISIQFDPIRMANDLRMNGGTIPGHRPGKPTSDFLTNAMHKLALPGSFALVLIAILPVVFGNLTGLSTQLGGTSLLIAVGVSGEILSSLSAYLKLYNRKSFVEG